MFVRLVVVQPSAILVLETEHKISMVSMAMSISKSTRAISSIRIAIKTWGQSWSMVLLCRQQRCMYHSDTRVQLQGPLAKYFMKVEKQQQFAQHFLKTKPP